MTDQQLQLALAKELPELISIIEPTDSGCHFETYFHWRDTDLALVTPREWDWIVRECEKKLKGKSIRAYVRALEYETDSMPASLVCVSAPWQYRAIAYFKTIAATR